MTLTPQRGMSGPMEVHAQLDLHIICNENYPNQIPSIKLKNSRGLSNQQIAVLSSELEELAKRLKGEVMILDLAQHVEKFLHENNKPGYSSFYEEMLSHHQEKTKQIQTEMEEKQLKEDKERQLLQDEILKRQEALKAELRNRKEMARHNHDSTIILSQSIPSSPGERMRTYSRRRCMSTSESSDNNSLCEHRGTKLLHFDNNRGERQVHRGKCLGHSLKGSVVYAGVDMVTGELLAITEWSLKCGSTGNPETNDTNNEATDLQHSMKQIASIEQELNHLHRLQHINLVRYLNMKYQQSKDNIVIYILEEFVVGTTCTFFLSENIPVAVDILRHIASGVLSALEFLHNNNIVHRDLRDSSIHIDRCGMVKVSDYSLNRRLSDIYRSSCLAKAEHDFPTIQGRGGKKLDIYRFGIILLSLFRGTIISEKEQTNEWAMNLPPELRDFLSKCLNNNERSRWSAEQLQQHSFIRIPIERGLSPPKLPREHEQDSEEPEEPMQDVNLYLPATLNNSRIQNEFEVLKWLGKGAFGDVIKVRNKLDGGIYAIKRIPLNAKNKQLNKKITREVKLLSRLNHENVVRYYNSWIEAATLDDHSNSMSSTRDTTRETTPNTPPEIDLGMLNINDDNHLNNINQFDPDNIEALVPPIKDVEWSRSYGSRASAAKSNESEDSDSESESDDEEGWGFFMGTSLSTDSSDSIEFERDDTSRISAAEVNSLVQDDAKIETKAGGNDVTETDSLREIQFMYIQMEFCEKSTLRTAIDNSLFEDEERVWRLFREIVEGIVHIHQQGMIHRDLKPVNIFLDSNDHVKIGDFGLATIDTRTPSERKFPAVEKPTSFEADEPSSMTGEVGTELYTAPELNAKTAKAIYNQKVDMYSLGIILFEMCCVPLSTGMERVKVLSDVRSKDIVLPQNFVDNVKGNVVNLLRWLLNHDPSQRPTSQELLSSEYLPPPQLEEAELQEMVRHTLSNNQSKEYKYLIGCCFAQEFTPAEDITYDTNLQPPKNNCSLTKTDLIREYVKAKVIEVFRKHGGMNLVTPLLMPKSTKFPYNQMESSVKLMTKSGNIVSIPSDLRAPFARYAAWNNILHMRRYAVERVYHEKKVHGFHPREFYECAFDIISNSVDLMAEAELIYIVWDIFNQLPELRDRNFVVRINHTSLLQAVLMYCGIEPEKYMDIYSILYDARDGKFTKFQVQTHLISLCLTDQAMSTLSNLFDIESPVTKITSVLRTITKRKGTDAAILAKEGLREIEAVVSNVEALGVKWQIIVAPLLVHKTQQQHSGIVYQITCEMMRKRRRGGHDVIAAGGRYDKMLASFRHLLERTGLANKDFKQHGVGISISLEKLIHAVGEMYSLETSGSELILSKFVTNVSVAVCCTDGPKRDQEMAATLRELWSLGLGAIALDFGTIDEVNDYCRENCITHAVILKFGEKGNLRIQTWERDRYQERKITVNEVGEFFQRQRTDNPLPVLTRSESKTNSNDNTPLNVTVNFILSEKDKLSGSGRRSYKNAMIAQMTSHLQRIASKVEVQVFGVFLEMMVIRTIVSHLEIDESEQDFERSVQSVIEKHLRYKKYIQQICNEMWETRNEKQRPTLVLYSLLDNRYLFLI
ncbi:eIF-2-alpha kinase GCN2 isoform X2 [Diachasmimorpha longicaudata]